MTTTAFIHASIAFPNCAGQASLILEKNRDKPFLSNIIKACIDAHEVGNVIVITSDNPADNVIDNLAKEYSSSAQKEVESFRLSSQLPYSFKPEKRKLREVSFPYLWYPAYGLYTLDGFKALTTQFKITNAIVIEASFSISVTPEFINAVAKSINNTAIRYIDRNPYREVIGVHIPFMYELMRTYIGKIQDTVINKGREPLITDVFHIAFSEDRKNFTSEVRNTYKQNLIPLLRKQDYSLIQCLQNTVWQDYAQHFDIVENYLHACVPEYLEIELLNKAKNTHLSAENVRGLISDFAKTGIAINFSGEDDPLLDNNVTDYIHHAKAHNVSVWLETDGTLLDKGKITNLVESGLDLFLITINNYLQKKEKLAEIITCIKEVKDEKGVLFPLVALQFIVDSWLDKEANEFIDSFDGTVDRIIIRSPWDYGDKNMHRKIIDFSPLRRSTCRQITHSLFVKAHDTVGICTRDRDGLIHPENKMKTKTACMLNDDNHYALIKEHNEHIFDKTFPVCSTCKEWYIPNINQNFSNINLSSFLDCHYEHYSLNIHDFALSDIEQHTQRLSAIICCCDAALAKGYTLVTSFKQRISQEKDINAIKYLNNEMQNISHHMENIELLKRKFNSYFIHIGDAYILHKEYEKALSVWESVLQYDPSNSYIHKQLDALLEVAEKR